MVGGVGYAGLCVGLAVEPTGGMVAGVSSTVMGILKSKVIDIGPSVDMAASSSGSTISGQQTDFAN